MGVKIQKIGKELEDDKPNIDHLVALAEEFDETAKSYEQTASTFQPGDEAVRAKKKEGKTTITRIVTVEVELICQCGQSNVV